MLEAPTRPQLVSKAAAVLINVEGPLPQRPQFAFTCWDYTTKAIEGYIDKSCVAA